MRQRIETITDEIEWIERKITFYLDASGHVRVFYTEYDVRHLRDVVSVRNHVLSRRPINLQNEISFYNNLHDELDGWTDCMRKVSRLREKTIIWLPAWISSLAVLKKVIEFFM
jgi:hypothetical protein